MIGSDVEMVRGGIGGHLLRWSAVPFRVSGEQESVIGVCDGSAGWHVFWVDRHVRNGGVSSVCVGGGIKCGVGDRVRVWHQSVDKTDGVSGVDFGVD